jgi:hypothetical protein
VLHVDGLNVACTGRVGNRNYGLETGARRLTGVVIEMCCGSVLLLCVPVCYRSVHCITWCSFPPEVVFCSGKCTGTAIQSCTCVIVMSRLRYEPMCQCADPQRKESSSDDLPDPPSQVDNCWTKDLITVRV